MTATDQVGTQASDTTTNELTVLSGAPIDISPLNNGVAAQDWATGVGYLMYSEESVHTRFSARAPFSTNSDHVIAVKFISGQWFYDNNAAYVGFTPQASDLLLAEVDFGLDTVTDLKGTSFVVNGIESGSADGDLVFTHNQWGGRCNYGEFEVSGTS